MKLLPVAVVAVMGVLGCAVPAAAHGSLAPAAAYDQMVLADQPAGYWAMNGTGTEPDLTGNGMTGTYMGGQPSAATLPDGETVAAFNGSSQYLTVAADPRLSITAAGELTWEAWIRPDTLNFPHTSSGYVNWLGKCQNYSPTCEWEARMYSQNTSRPSRLSAYVFNPTAGLGSGAYWQEYSTSQIRAGHWYHVVGEYQTLTQPPGCAGPQTGSINIWVNGVEWVQARHGQTGCMSQYGITPAAGSSPLDIATVALDNWFKGAIGKVAVYDYLLTQAQISAHYTAMTGLAPGGDCNYLNSGECVFTSP